MKGRPGYTEKSAKSFQKIRRLRLESWGMPKRPSTLEGASLSTDYDSAAGLVHLLLDEIDLLERSEAKQFYTPHVHYYLKAVYDFYGTKNRFFADRAFEMASRNGFPLDGVFPLVQMDAIKAARQKVTTGSHLQAAKSEWLPSALALIEEMRNVGMPLDEAASRAAQWLAVTTDGQLTYKASSMEKLYADHAKTHPSSDGDDSDRPMFGAEAEEKRTKKLEYFRRAFPRVSRTMIGTRR